MTRSVLVLNSGSSSVKYAVVDPDSGTMLADGIVERIGEGVVPDHAAALQVVFDELADDIAVHSSQSGTGWCTAGRICMSRRSSTTR